MVEIPSCQYYERNVAIETYTPLYVGFAYFQEYGGKKPFTVNVRENNAINVLKNSISQDIEEQIYEPSIFNADVKRRNISREQRLNSIFEICLEAHDLGDYLSLTSPKNFVVQYFTVSRNHPVKNCCRSQCPFAGQTLRSQESRQKPACSELPRCKHSQIATQDQFSHCVNPPNEIHNALVNSTPCNNSFRKVDDSHMDRTDCSSTCSSDSCCTSKTFVIESSRMKKKHTLQQTEPEPSWQAKCSNFIINLPVTLSDKLFGPRTTCETLKDGKCTIHDDDLRVNRIQLGPKNTSKPGSRDHGNKKSVQSRVCSLADHGCDKNVGTDRVFVEKSNQVDPCYSRTSQSIQEDVPYRKCFRKSDKSETTFKKVTSKCSKYCQDNCARLEVSENRSESIHSHRSEPHERRSSCGARNQTNSSISGRKKRGNASPHFSNWPAILTEKFFSPRNEKVMRCCVIDNEVRHKKAADELEDGPEIVPEVGSSSTTKKGRLLLKKYTISQTPEAMEETLCFDIRDGKQLTETKSKLQSRVCVKMNSDNQQKLETIQERSEVLSKCSGAATETGRGTSRSHKSKRSLKSRGKVKKISSRKTQKLEKKTSTEHIFFSSLIIKLLNKHRSDMDHTCNGEECHRKSVSEKNGNKRDQQEKKCALKHRTNTISRKYATTSIYKHRNKSIKCAECIGKKSRKNEAISCSLEQNVSPVCCTVVFPNSSGEDKNRRKIKSNLSGGREEVANRERMQANPAEDNLCENVRDLSKKVTRRMTTDHTDHLEDKSTEKDECQGCDSSGSSEVEGLLKSGVLRVIDKSCRRESRELCCSALHREKREVKSDTRKRCCKRVSSPKEFPCRVRRRNEIQYNDSQSVCRGIPQFLVEGTPKTFVIAGENICVKMFRDRETCTDGLPGSADCQSSRYIEERRPNRELLHDQTTVDKNIKNCSPSIQITEQNSIANVIQSSKIQGLSRGSTESYSHSKSSDEGRLVNPNDNSSTRNQPENALRIRIGSEEFVGSRCDDDACWVRPEGILEGENIREAEQDVGKVFRSLSQEACGERGNTVCGSKTCLHKDLMKSETNGALGMSEEDNSYQGQDTVVKSSSLVTTKVSSSEKRDDGSSDKYKDMNNNANKTEQLDVVHMKIESPAKRSNWIKSRGTDLTVTIPEPRSNTINSYYFQRRSVLASRCEVRNNEHSKVKKGKVERDGSVSKRSGTKARRPLQRIENVRPVGCSANVLIEDDKSKNLDTFEKENSIVNEKTPYTRDGNVLDHNAKNPLVQNIAITNLNLPEGFFAVPNNNYALSVQKLDETDSLNSETQTPVSRIPKKSNPLIKSRTPARDSASTTKALENSSTKVKESSRKSWLKKGNSGTASNKIDAKGTAKDAGKILECKSSNRLTRSIDTSCDGKSSEEERELKTPTYIFDKERTKARTLQIEMSSIEEQNIPNSPIGNTTGWVAKGRESSESNKSASLQRNGVQREDDRSRNVASAREMRENIKHAKGNQSKSGTASKKNENDKKSTPLKLLSQLDSEMDANNSMQEQVTTNADLFASAQTAGKNNIKSYRDLQLAAEENSNSKRISTSKDEGLRKSGTATVPSKSKVSKLSKSSKTSVKKTPGTNISDKKLRNFKGSTSRITKAANITDKDGTGNLSRVSPASVHIEDNKVKETDVTEASSVLEVGNTETRTSTICKNNVNREKNSELRSPAENSKEVEQIANQNLRASKSDLKKNSIPLTDCNFDENCTSRTVKNAAPVPKKIPIEKSSVCNSSEEPSHEKPPCKFRGSSCPTKNRTPSSYSRTSSESNQITKQGVHKDVLRPGSSYKSCKVRYVCESNHARGSSKDLGDMEEQAIHCSAKRENIENKSEEEITRIEDSMMPRVKCKQSTGSECNSIKFKRPCKDSQNFSDQAEKEIVEQNNVPDKLIPFCTSRKVISDSSTRNSSFTDDLKRFVDQGQEFFSLNRRKNCNQIASSSDSKQDPGFCNSGKFNESEASCKTSEFCKSIDYEKMKKSSKICDGDQTSNDSISSLQKAYTTLKTIMNRTKSIPKGFMNAEQSKETQIHTPILDKSSIPPIKEVIKPHENAKSLEPKISKDNKSPTVSISFGSSIFSNLISPICREQNKKL